MPELRPFRGLLYDVARANLADVVAPPYDVIGGELRETLYDASPYNVVRLDLSREADPYTSAARDFARWKAEKTLVTDARPCIYLLTQEFPGPDGRSLKRRGFIALCKLEDFSAGTILPHERTMSKPKEDRLRLLKTTNAHFSQIFCLYADPEHALDAWLDGGGRGGPSAGVRFEGVQNHLSRLVDPEGISAIQRFMEEHTVLIADGHHRYETSLAFRDIKRHENPRHTGTEPYNFIMMYCTNLHDEGLLILPTHRIVHQIESFEPRRMLDALARLFEIQPCENDAIMLRRLGERKRFAFGLVLPTGCSVFWPRDAEDIEAQIDAGIPPVLKKLDVTVLHTLVLDKVLGISAEGQEKKINLDYVKESRDAIQAVRSGAAQAAFIMNPTPVDQVRAVAGAGLTMPQKSTYFYPKLLSGLVMFSLNVEDQ